MVSKLIQYIFVSSFCNTEFITIPLLTHPYWKSDITEQCDMIHYKYFSRECGLIVILIVYAKRISYLGVLKF